MMNLFENVERTLSVYHEVPRTKFMRFLLVNIRHFYGGGDITYTFSLAELLQDNGSVVGFFAMQDEHNLLDPNENLFVSPIDSREINRDKNFVNGLKVMGRVIYSQEARRNFSRMLDGIKPDIVHLQNIHAHITPSIIIEAKNRGIPVVWTTHVYKLICPNSHFLIDVSGEIREACIKGVFLNALLKRCKKGSFLASTMAATEAYAHQLMGIRKKVDAYLSPNAFLMQKLSEGGVREPIFHLPSFVDEEYFHQSVQDHGNILFFGILDTIKGIYLLLEASKNIPGIKLKIALRIHETEEDKIWSLFNENIDYVGVKTGGDLRW